MEVSWVKHVIFRFQLLVFMCVYVLGFFLISVALTVFGDMNGPALCEPMFRLIHTGQVPSLMKVQRKLISQPGFLGTFFIL